MLFRIRHLVLLGTAVLAFSLAPQAQAYENEGPSFQFNTQTYSRSDVDTGGNYSRTDMGVKAANQWFTLSYKRSDYNWHGNSQMSGGADPWDHLQKLALDATFDGPLTDSVDWFAGGTVMSAFEDELWGSFSLLPRAGLLFHASPDVKIKLGAIGMLSPVRPLAAPLVSLDWRTPMDTGFSAKVGFPLTEVQYRFNSQIAARANVQWNRDVYRLANDSTVSRKGYMEESGVTGGAYLDVTPLDRLTLTLGAELMGYRSIDIYTKHGNRISSTDVDPAVGAVFRAGYSF